MYNWDLHKFYKWVWLWPSTFKSWKMKILDSRWIYSKSVFQLSGGGGLEGLKPPQLFEHTYIRFYHNFGPASTVEKCNPQLIFHNYVLEDENPGKSQRGKNEGQRRWKSGAQG